MKNKDKNIKNIKIITPPKNFKEIGFTHLLFNMLAQGCSHIEFNYSGGGDSGCIDTIIPYPIKNTKNKSISLELENSLESYLNDVVSEKILDSTPNWWNSEGGGGTLILYCSDGSYKGEHYVNYISRDESELEGKIGDNGIINEY